MALLGPTGSGKSTLLNSLAQRDLSPVGARRPTSDRLVVWADPRRLRPGEGALAGLAAELMDAPDPLLQRLALVDTPDLDSDVGEHRQLALAAGAAAHCLVFVVSPVRYADAALWSAVEAVAVNRKPVVFVLNRATPQTAGATAGLAAMVRSRLRWAPAPIEVAQLRPSRSVLPARLVGELRSHLQGWGRRASAIRRMAVTPAQAQPDDA